MSAIVGGEGRVGDPGANSAGGGARLGPARSRRRLGEPADRDPVAGGVPDRRTGALEDRPRSGRPIEVDQAEIVGCRRRRNSLARCSRFSPARLQGLHDGCSFWGASSRTVRRG